MPKEAIYGDPQDRFVLEVGWQRDQDVQVGIRTADHMHLVDEFYGELVEPIGRDVLFKVCEALGIDAQPDYQGDPAGWFSRLGREVLDVVTGSDYGMESLWWHPGRHQINELIRALRKARDAAYGRDE